MAISKKDFVAIAKIIREYRDDYGNGKEGQATAAGIARDLADYFKLANGNFNRHRFLEAAGVIE